jgi:hypothetical protein
MPIKQTPKAKTETDPTVENGNDQSSKEARSTIQKLPERRLFSDSVSMAIVIGTSLLGGIWIIVAFFSHRFDLIPVVKGDSAIFYRIDRLTGRTSICTSSGCTNISR